MLVNQTPKGKWLPHFAMMKLSAMLLSGCGMAGDAKNALTVTIGPTIHTIPIKECGADPDRLSVLSPREILFLGVTDPQDTITPKPLKLRKRS